MASQTVEVPGIGDVDFPDSMSDDEIGKAIRRLLGEPEPKLEPEINFPDIPAPAPPSFSQVPADVSSVSPEYGEGQRLSREKAKKTAFEKEENIQAGYEFAREQKYPFETPEAAAERKTGIARKFAPVATAGDVYKSLTLPFQVAAAGLEGKTPVEKFGERYRKTQSLLYHSRALRRIKEKEKKGEPLTAEEAKTKADEPGFWESVGEAVRDPVEFGKQMGLMAVEDAPLFLAGGGIGAALAKMGMRGKALAEATALARKTGTNLKRLDRLKKASEIAGEATSAGAANVVLGVPLEIQKGIEPTAKSQAANFAIGAALGPAMGAVGRRFGKKPDVSRETIAPDAEKPPPQPPEALPEMLPEEPAPILPTQEAVQPQKPVEYNFITKAKEEIEALHGIPRDNPYVAENLVDKKTGLLREAKFHADGGEEMTGHFIFEDHVNMKGYNNVSYASGDNLLATSGPIFGSEIDGIGGRGWRWGGDELVGSGPDRASVEAVGKRIAEKSRETKIHIYTEDGKYLGYKKGFDVDWGYGRTPKEAKSAAKQYRAWRESLPETDPLFARPRPPRDAPIDYLRAGDEPGGGGGALLPPGGPSGSDPIPGIAAPVEPPTTVVAPVIPPKPPRPYEGPEPVSVADRVFESLRSGKALRIHPDDLKKLGIQGTEISGGEIAVPKERWKKFGGPVAVSKSAKKLEQIAHELNEEFEIGFGEKRGSLVQGEKAFWDVRDVDLEYGLSADDLAEALINRSPRKEIREQELSAWKEAKMKTGLTGEMERISSLSPEELKKLEAEYGETPDIAAMPGRSSPGSPDEPDLFGGRGRVSSQGLIKGKGPDKGLEGLPLQEAADLDEISKVQADLFSKAQAETPPESMGGLSHAALNYSPPLWASPSHVNPAAIALEPPKGTKLMISAPKAISAFENVLNVLGRDIDVRTGRMTGRRALGQYFLKDRVIRIRTANDVETAAHEIGHAIDYAFFGAGHKWMKDASVPRDAKKNLVKLGRELYEDKKPVGGYAGEGYAEWSRLYFNDPPQAKAKAPAFTSYMEGAVFSKNKEFYKAVQDAQKAGTDWFQQGAVARMKASIAPTKGTVERFAEGVKETSGGGYQKWIESAAKVQEFSKVANLERKAAGKAELPAGEDPYQTLGTRRLTADKTVENMAYKGMEDFNRNRRDNIRPLVDAFKLVKPDEVDDFMAYLLAKRGQAMHLDPKGPRNPGVTLKDAQHVISKFDSPRFGEAGRIVWAWNDGLLDYAAQGSRSFAKVVEKIRDRDPGFYIPLLREFMEIDKRYAAKGGTKDLMARLMGSGRRVKAPIESMLKRAKDIVLRTNQQAVVEQVIRIYRNTEGLGDFIAKVPETRAKVFSASLKDLYEKVKKGLDESGVVIKAEGEIDPLDLNQMIDFFAPSGHAGKGERPVYRYLNEKGDFEFYELHPDFQVALEGMDIKRLGFLGDLFLGKPARAMRLGTTGLSASFSMIRNPTRDFSTLHKNSQASGNSAELLYEYLASLSALAQHTFSGGRLKTSRTPWIDLAERLGIKMATPLGQDAQPLARAARKIKRGGSWKPLSILQAVKDAPYDAIDVMVDLLQFPEMAARITEMKLIAKDMGWDPSMPITADIVNRLTLVGKRVSTDFTQAGEYARVINQAVPFFNANIQGPVAHVRAAKANPAKFMRRGLEASAFALAMWYRNKDEEWWKEMKDEDRFLHTFIKLGDEIIRIPRAFEVDGLFMGGAEALADAWYREDPKLATEWFGTWIKNMSQLEMAEVAGAKVPIPPLPVLPLVALEQIANRKFHFDRPIVGNEFAAPEKQFSPYTAKAAIAISKLFPDIPIVKSPQRLEHAIRGVFGTVGADLLALGGRGIEGREKELSDIPVVGTLFVRGGKIPQNPKSVDRLYELYGETTRKSSSGTETEEDMKKRLILSDAIRAIAALRQVANTTPERGKRALLEAEIISISKEAVKAEERTYVPPMLERKKKTELSKPSHELTEEEFGVLLKYRTIADSVVAKRKAAPEWDSLNTDSRFEIAKKIYSKYDGAAKKKVTSMLRRRLKASNP